MYIKEDGRVEYCKKKSNWTTQNELENWIFAFLSKFRYIFKLREVSKPILQSRKQRKVFQKNLNCISDHCIRF